MERRQNNRQRVVAGIKRLFPIAKWIPSYTLKVLPSDILSGLAVAMIVLPQSLAIAALAGVPPQYGLYSSFCGDLVYVFFGTSKDVTVGPTVLTAITTGQSNVLSSPSAVSTMAFISGVLVLAVGILKLGFISAFISGPVFRAYISSAAIIISFSQLTLIFGLKGSPKHFFGRVKYVFTHLQDVNVWDTSMGVICVFILMSLHFIGNGKWKLREPSSLLYKILKYLLVTIVIARSTLIAIFATLIAYSCQYFGYENSFTLAGHFPSGLPTPQMPIRSVKIDGGGQNVTNILAPSEVLGQLGFGFMTVSLVMIIEIISVTKYFSRMGKYTVDMNQELIAVGIGNIVGSFFGSFPVTASFVRSAVRHASGGRTLISGVVSGIIVLVAMEVLTPLFKFAPMAALGALVFAAAVPIIEVKLPLDVWRTNKLDIIPVAATIVCSFYEITLGIIVGSMTGLALILYRVANPRMTVHQNEAENETTVIIQGGIQYPSIGAIHNRFVTILNDSNSYGRIVIDLKHIKEIDYAVLQMFKAISMEARVHKKILTFSNVNSQNVLLALQKGGLVRTKELVEGVLSEEHHERLAVGRCKGSAQYEFRLLGGQDVVIRSGL